MRELRIHSGSLLNAHARATTSITIFIVSLLRL